MGQIRSRVIAAILVVGMVLAPQAASAQTEVDACTLVPDSGPTFDFTEACATHDQCYIDKPHGTDSAGRRGCDVDFYWDMIESCQEMWPGWTRFVQRSSCYGVAVVYYLGVRAFGAFGWESGESPALAEAG